MTDILGRMGNILRANLNDMLDHAEGPEKMMISWSATTPTT